MQPGDLVVMHYPGPGSLMKAERTVAGIVVCLWVDEQGNDRRTSWHASHLLVVWREELPAWERRVGT